jgi:hypothetical protein
MRLFCFPPNIPKIKHYGIYDEARKLAQQLAVEWFDQHSKKQ